MRCGNISSWHIATKVHVAACPQLEEADIKPERGGFPVIGFLAGASPDAYYSSATAPFLRGLKETGYVERQSVAIEYRWAEDHYDRLPVFAVDLVHREVAVIATFDTASSLAAKAATAMKSQRPAIPLGEVLSGDNLPRCIII
jgi:hypothetical protein